MEKRQGCTVQKWTLFASALAVLCLGVWFVMQAEQDAPGGLQMEPVSGGTVAAVPPGGGAASEVQEMAISLAPQRESTVEATESTHRETRSFAGVVQAGKTTWPVPEARVRLMWAERLLGETTCDGQGAFELQCSLSAAQIDDERTHWVVTSEAYFVEDSVAFDPEDQSPRLVVAAHLVVTGTTRSPYVGQWPFTSVYMEPCENEQELRPFAKRLVEKDGSFRMHLPTTQLRDSMVVVFDDENCSPHRLTIRPGGLNVELGRIELPLGQVLRGVVASRLPDTYRGQYVTAYLNEYGEDIPDLPNRGGRIIDGELCSLGKHVRVGEDGSFVMRGLARRRYRLVVPPSGPFRTIPGTRVDRHMVTVDMRLQDEDSAPLQLHDWWAVVRVTLSKPEDKALPQEAQVHGKIPLMRSHLGNAEIDAQSASFWLAIAPDEPGSWRLRFQEAFAEVALEVGAQASQTLSEVHLVLRSDDSTSQDLQVQIMDPAGEPVSHVYGQEIALRMTLLQRDAEGVWAPLNEVQPRAAGKHWVIPGLRPGFYRLRVLGDGYNDPDLMLALLEGDVEIGVEPPDPLRMQFQLAGRAVVRLIDKSGQPVSRRLVEVLMPDGRVPALDFWKPMFENDPGQRNLFLGFTSELGLAGDMLALIPGRYLVRAKTRAGEVISLEQEIEILEGQITEVELICTLP